MINNVDPQLSQWDVGRSVSVSKTDATHVHFANQGDSKAFVVEIKAGTAEIPDYLLQTGKTLIAYCVLNGVTLESKSFSVRKRERPEDYVYEKGQRDYIYELITDAQTATEEANQATLNANEAADKASQASAGADLATENANGAADNAKLAAKNANDSAAKAAHTAKNLMVVGTASGENIVLDDAIDQYLVGCRIFGKTTQDGTPTPDAPVELVSVENPTVAVNDQSMLVPYTLRGIPVPSGGNYTDSNGQQWVCDEVDFARRVYVQRIHKYICTGKEAWEKSNIQGSALSSAGLVRYDAIPNPHQPKSNRSDVLSTHCLFAGTNAYSKDSGMSAWVAGDANIGFLSVRIAASFDTNEDLKAWLAEQNAAGTPLTIFYALATPIETPLSEEELAAYAALQTSRGITTISNDADAYMDIAYVMDAKKYIDSLVGTSAGLLNATVE